MGLSLFPAFMAPITHYVSFSISREVERMNPKLLRLQVLLEEELVERLDQWRISHMPLRSRSQAIARLIAEGMGEEEEAG